MSPRSGADSLSSSRKPPGFAYERRLLRRGIGPVAGVDEAGRGPLAGPVVAAAVILDPKRIPPGLDDSKKLSAERREELFLALVATATVAWAAAPRDEIDRDNIRAATLSAMARAVAALSMRPAAILVDGRDIPPQVGHPTQAIIDGDAICLSIAAASIVAKVARDRLMATACRHYPGYGFSAHVGYATAGHSEALVRLGPCELHRRSFAPVAAFFQAGN